MIFLTEYISYTIASKIFYIFVVICPFELISNDKINKNVRNKVCTNDWNLPNIRYTVMTT